MKRLLALPFLTACLLIQGTQLLAQKNPGQLAPPKVAPQIREARINELANAWKTRILSGVANAQKATSNGQRLSALADYDYTSGSQFVDSAHFKYSGARGSAFDYLNLYYSTAPQSDQPNPYAALQGYVNYDSLWYYTPPGSSNADLYGARSYTSGNKISTDLYPENWYSEYQYNGAGQLTVRTDFMYNTTTQTWDSTFRDSYTYNGTGQLTQDSVEQRQGNVWEAFANIYYAYNASGQPIRQSVYQPLNGTWTFVYVSDVNYSLTNQKADKILSRGYDSKTMNLVPVSLDTIGYQSGVMNYYYSYLWIDSTSSWDLYYEERRHLNARALPDSTWIRFWDAGVATDTGRLLITYNSMDNPTRGFFYLGNHTNVDLEARWYYEDAPSGVNAVSAMKMEVYPNPAGDKVYVKNMSAGNYRLYNSAGQLLQAGVLDASGGIIIGALPQGIYYLQLSDRNGQSGHAVFLKK